MTPFLNALMTSAVIAGGALAIVYALRWFPVAKGSTDQMEMDFDVVPDYIKRTRAAAHDARNATDVVRDETRRIKAKPKIKR